MKRGFKIAILVFLALSILAASIVYISNHNIAVLEPKGMIGQKESDLIITASLLMLIVVIPVLIITWAFAWKYRKGNSGSHHAPDWEHNYIAECCWWGVPVVIIIILAVITWKSTHELNPFTPIRNDKKPVVIQVVALQWKWLFIYPEEKIATINFIQFPEKTPIDFEITADAPMNSFWIPQLGGQIYAMPAMRSKLHLIADEPGVFRGLSSNISGTGFAKMTFTAKASSQEAFEQWVQSVKQSGQTLTLEEYNRLIPPTERNPVTYYMLGEEGLFDQIMMKYMMPPEGGK